MFRILVRNFCNSGKKYLRTELPPPETKFKTWEEAANASSPPQLHLLAGVRILLAIPTQPQGLSSPMEMGHWPSSGLSQPGLPNRQSSISIFVLANNFMVNTVEPTLPVILTHKKNKTETICEAFLDVKGRNTQRSTCSPLPWQPANPLLTLAEQTLQLRAAHSTAQSVPAPHRNYSCKLQCTVPLRDRRLQRKGKYKLIARWASNLMGWTWLMCSGTKHNIHASSPAG